MASVKKQFDITGMHCGSCAAGIQMFVSSLDGVESATVDYDTAKADIEYSDDKVSPEQIVDGVKELGYGATQA